MTIEVVLDKLTFRRFALFDMLRHRKQWRSPALFALILCASGGICFAMRLVEGAALLGIVLMAVGLGLPLVYFLSFFQSLNKQITANDLLRPRKVYTVHVEDDGIRVENEKEQAHYSWNQVHHAYRDTLAIYLYITPQRAFLLPGDCIPDSPDALWNQITQALGHDHVTIL